LLPRRRRKLHRIAALQRLGRAVDHAVGGRKARCHLDTVAEVAAELNLLQHSLVVAAEDGNLRAIIDRHQSRRRHAHHGGITRELEMHLAIGSGEQLGIRVVGLQFD
jgi:hypothetical protein